ncbi:MAG: PIN domain-containing protein [Rhodospirillales bacterium]
MTERFSLDSNILVYSVDAASADRHRRAVDIVEAAIGRDCVLALQALVEFYHATTRKRIATPRDVATKVEEMGAIFPIVAADHTALLSALPAAVTARYSMWDALLLATVEQAGCTLLLSEDMGDGARHGGVTVLNPFRGAAIPRRAAVALGLR